MAALREIVPETRAAVQAIKRACTEQLAPYQMQQLFGCGVEGCVYKAGEGRAVKLSINADEARAAEWVKDLGTSRPPALPVIYEVRSLEACAPPGGAFVIEREDLSDLRATDPRLVNQALTAVETATAFSPDVFAREERQRAAGAVRLLGSYIGIARKDAWIVKQLYEFTLWCVDRGVAFLDLHTQNLGVRAGTRQIVVRDFGHSDIPGATGDVQLAGRSRRRGKMARMVLVRGGRFATIGLGRTPSLVEIERDFTRYVRGQPAATCKKCRRPVERCVCLDRKRTESRSTKTRDQKWL